MHTRLNERLLEMAKCSEEKLIQLLIQIEASTDSETLHKARTLYETLLSSPYSIRTSTFHSFCQDILRKFPMEAGIAPGFELVEATQDLKNDAWNAVCSEASLQPDGEIAQTLETLIDACDGLGNTATAVNSFIDHRSDWWAFTEGQENPLAFAIETLSNQLGTPTIQDPYRDFFSDDTLVQLGEFSTLLEKHPIKANNEALKALSLARDASYDYSQRFKEVIKAFLTQKGEPRQRKESQVQAKKMGETGQQRFLEIHNLLCTAIKETQVKLYTLHAYQRMCAWYRAGVEVIDCYQQLKNELRVLDFSDLEWRAYLLLNHSDNVHWIQYKLDQRIDHLLVDEFQDTNPTQWRLILPLLEELASGTNERQRSVFLVGDNKQSIYRFRRADPELFDTAQQWLKDKLKAISQPLDISWRSSDAIISFVNRVFGSGPLNERINQFSPHSTHFPDLWGRVEILPLIEAVIQEESDDENNLPLAIRNPLITPRIIETDQRHFEEGQLIADHINNLISAQTLINERNISRPIRYSDIIILIRNRTNVADYERALREAGIPYAGADRGALLNCLEIRDLVNLLELLITPFNNLALANVLRSPIFDCSNEDLICLARQKESSWIDKLSALSSGHNKANQSVSEKIVRAHNLLSQWRTLADKLPVHDLLDHIYSEGNLINRYQAGYPHHLRHSVTANLTRFIELALEIDSGRHPTVGRFVSRLNTLRQQDKEAPDEGSPIQADSRVRIMTIHSAKGLEAPAVFLADSAFSSRDKTAYHAVVNWPASEDRPNSFLLAGKKDSQDPFTSAILEQHASAEAREDANLLYVALTRARQLLFISGCHPNKGNNLGWYGMISKQCLDDENNVLTTIETGTYPKLIDKQETAEATITTITPELSLPLTREDREFIIAPSYQTGTLNELSNEEHGIATDYLREEAQLRGIVIHRCLQLLCNGHSNQEEFTHLSNQLKSELGVEINHQDLDSWIDEALNVYNHQEFSQFFNASQYQESYSEVPIQYFKDEQMVYGIVDRLVVTESEAWIIDYKTHRITDDKAIADIKEKYRQQIEYYCLGARKVWPDRMIRGFLLLTHNMQLMDLEI